MRNNPENNILVNSIKELKNKLDEVELDPETSILIDDFINSFSTNLEDNLNKQVLSVNKRLKEKFKEFSYFPGLVLIFDKSNKVVFQNKDILGKAKIIGQKLGDILNFINSTGLLKDTKKVWKSGKPVKTSFINPVNQKTIDIHLNKCEVDGEFFLLTFLDDINIPFLTNKAKSKAIDQDRQRVALINKYRVIANSITDIFFILDEKLKFTFIAPSVERALQYNYNELVGQGFDILIPEWSGNTLKKNLDTVLAIRPNISEPQRFTIQLSGKYGNLNWYEVQITGIYDSGNDLKGFNGVCRDITERLKYEEALRSAKQKAEESDKLKSAFLANMSHEIRTPLNGIIGFSSMLTNKAVPEEKKELYADYIISSSKQLLTLISDIIDISKIEATQISVVNTKIDVAKILGELKDTIGFEKDRLEKESVEIKLILPKEDCLFFDTDEIRFKQILINLLSNALKFTTTGSIIFGCDVIEENIRFYVKDTGVGIPVNLQNAVFERFRQGNVDNSAKIAGTGLGLAISKGLVELMGGSIGVKSQEGVGSEFYFTLPYTT